jgi:ATP-dependent Lon protease
MLSTSILVEKQIEPDIVSLMSQEEERKINEGEIPKKISILPLRNMVLFPGIIIPITAGRKKSIELIEKAYSSNSMIGTLTQKQTNIENPSAQDLYTIGTVAKIIKLLKMPDNSTMIILQGKIRFQVKEFTQITPYIKAEIIILQDEYPNKNDKEYQAIIDSIRDLSIKVIQENPNLPSEAIFAIKNIENPSFLVNFVAANMNLSVTQKQKLLENNQLKKRSINTFQLLNIEHQQIKLKNDIQSRVKIDMDQQQKEYFLHQQIKAIQEELGDSSYEKEIDEFRLKSKKKKWYKEIKNHFEKELNKMQRTNPQLPDYIIIRNYLEFMLDLPWKKYSKDNFNLNKVSKILNTHHYGLDKIKERIIEYLAVLKIRKDMKSPIICLYGPPGIGKTSLGKSIALSLNRKYARISLGGIHDEAEIRGHRKTYIGAMPGRLLQSIKKVGTSNPVFVLDEIDKIGTGVQGNPSSAMLEVLDPEQNNSFYDNFLELGYDLSKIMFIATANNLNTIHPALLDRMEIIEMNGYSIEEKVQIAKKHLLPKQIKTHGLKKNDIILHNRKIENIIEYYTRESGVRNLEKKISKIVRRITKNIATNKYYEKNIKNKQIKEILGLPRFIEKYEKYNKPGVVPGLAWTSVGGEILYIESIFYKGKGELTITGNLGSIMKESAIVAIKYIKAYHEDFNINYNLIAKQDVHINVPEGAVPKDGPSAGITMLSSLVSSLTNTSIKPYLAMTGEITLRGSVLPVGGIQEKILAAKRAGIKEIILPKINKNDIMEINKQYIKGLTFHYVTDIKEVIKIAIPTI